MYTHTYIYIYIYICLFVCLLLARRGGPPEPRPGAGGWFNNHNNDNITQHNTII